MSSTCDDSISLIGKAENLLASIFCPGCASTIANANLQKLACWAAKQANLTSEICTDLMKDVDSNRKAILQNHAAIDFLLLANGHGCNDFDGMCCFNLSDHSKSIHAKIQELRENVDKIRIETGLDDWLKNLGISGWLKPLIYSLLQLLLTLVVLFCIICGIFACGKKLMAKTISKIWLVQQLPTSDGIINTFMMKNGHVYEDEA